MELQTVIQIDASPERVWEVLTDFPAYGQWNPFIREISGEVREGAPLSVTLGPPDAEPRTFRPTVTVAEAPAAFSWLGTLGGAWLFRGEHQFRLVRRADGGTRFHHAEHFGGLLLPVLRRGLETDTRAGFEAMNRALKVRAETG